MKKNSFVFLTIVLCTMAYATQVFAVGIVIVPTSGPGYAPGKPCTVTTLTDDGQSYTEEGTFNSDLECKISYGVIASSGDQEETSPLSTLVTTWIQTIRIALHSGTAVVK